MLEINWKQDYQGEFVCPKCNESPLGLGGTKRGKRHFRCPKCKAQIGSSIDINIFSIKYLKSDLKKGDIDWNKDYKGEFICPLCDCFGMVVRNIHKGNKKRMFGCSNCKKAQIESYSINIQAIEDPINKGILWYTNHQIKGFICPVCQSEDMYFTVIDCHNKKKFRCRTCKREVYDSIWLKRVNLSRYSEAALQVIPFKWSNDKWDLRAINPNFDERDSKEFIVVFANIEPYWFKEEVKKYIKHLCKSGSSHGTIRINVSSLRSFSRYLIETKINGFNEINRSLILDYLSQEQKRKGIKSKLGSLRKFFRVGTLRSWFNIDQDIIRDEDYPKQYRGNPDSISDPVKEQIEQNLHQLPDPIARMWLIIYFAAMRPSELALLKRDCLVQEGQHWKLVWQRKKSKDYHEIPISNTIAKVVQEQQEYIQNLWGDNWIYLFCHYRNLSTTDLLHPNLEAVQKIIPNQWNSPLLAGIRTLIKALDIRDENGQPAKFQSKLLRSTRATNLFEQGHELSVVSAWLGHKNFATTSTYYTQVSCDLMQREAGHIQQALVTSDGLRISYESFPKSFWDNPIAHKLELADTHINTPIYGYCGLPLDRDCHKFRACYTCESFVATVEKLPEYINTLNELQAKSAKAMSSGHEVLVEQYGRQAEQLHKIIANLQPDIA